MNKRKYDFKTPIFQLTIGEFLSILRNEEKPQVFKHQLPEVFGIKTLQELTEYSKPAIYSKTSKKEIPHFRRDGRLFFRRDQILDWLTENPVKTIEERSKVKDEYLTKSRRRGAV